MGVATSSRPARTSSISPILADARPWADPEIGVVSSVYKLTSNGAIDTTSEEIACARRRFNDENLSMIEMKQGIRTNAVAAGPVWIPLIPATMPEEKVKKFG